MSRIQSVFEKKGKKLVTFITAGDPDYHKSLEVLKGLPKAGADIIELGMPFTDPAADGPSIQAANNRALKAGANMKQTLRMVREFRQDDTDTPLVLMGYANPVLAYGFADFVKDAASAGIDGLIIVDLPPEEDQKLRQLTSKAGIDLIRLITPTSNEKRLPALLTGVSGFLYYVSITGVTGAAKADMNKIKPHIAEIKKQTDIPVALGFGIKTPEDAKAMAEIADAIVVGSAIVNTLADKGPDAALEQVRALAQALAS